MKLERNASKEIKIFNIWFAKISDPLTAKMRHFKIWVEKNIHLNGIYNYSEYLQHSYSVYRGRLSTSFHWPCYHNPYRLDNNHLLMLPHSYIYQCLDKVSSDKTRCHGHTYISHKMMILVQKYSQWHKFCFHRNNHLNVEISN